VPQVNTPAPQITDTSGVDKSAIYRINATTPWRPLEFQRGKRLRSAGAAEPGALSTDQNGRIYGLAPDLRLTLVTETGEGETRACCLPATPFWPPRATWATSIAWRKAGASGSYEAPVHDSGTASRWGNLTWRADVPAGCGLVFRTRSGNSARPDAPGAIGRPAHRFDRARIASPNARYIQWKVESPAVPALLRC